MLQLFTDTSANLPVALTKQHHITVVPFSYTVDGKETDYPDDVDFDGAAFYGAMRRGAVVKTSMVNPDLMANYFERALSQGDDVLYVGMSGGISGTAQAAVIAAGELTEKYPARKIVTIDTYAASLGEGLQVLEAARMAAEGMGPEEIVQQLEALTARVDTSFILEQLEYMKKSGRCSAVALLGANLLKLRPCIEVKDGKMGIAKKYRGTFAKCLEAYIADRLAGRDDIELGRIFITHSGVPDEIIALAKSCIAKYQTFDEVCVTRAGCTVSSHCGPGTIGILFIRK